MGEIGEFYGSLSKLNHNQAKCKNIMLKAI